MTLDANRLTQAVGTEKNSCLSTLPQFQLHVQYKHKDHATRQYVAIQVRVIVNFVTVCNKKYESLSGKLLPITNSFQRLLFNYSLWLTISL